jgi:hypothetical protein
MQKEVAKRCDERGNDNTIVPTKSSVGNKLISNVPIDAATVSNL